MNHYHAIILRPDETGQNQRATIEAETIEQARELFGAKYGKEAVFKVWTDYTESKFRGYDE
jgi:hypothetical protein